MTDWLCITTSRASSCDRNERTTHGFCVDLQLGPLIFAFWLTLRPFWKGVKMPIHAKVTAGGLAGAITVLLVWAVSIAGLDVPPEVASAFTVVISFAAGYLKTA